MNSINVLLLLMVAVSYGSAQLNKKGFCPSPEVVKPFNMTQILGKWFHQEEVFFDGSPEVKCINDVYFEGQFGQYLLNTTAYLPAFKQWDNTTNLLAFSNKRNEGYLQVLGDVKVFRHWVIATDYKNYLVYWLCVDGFGDENWQTMAIDTRKKAADKKLITKIKKDLTAKGFDIKGMKPTPYNC